MFFYFLRPLARAPGTTPCAQHVSELVWLTLLRVLRGGSVCLSARAWLLGVGAGGAARLAAPVPTPSDHTARRPLTRRRPTPLASSSERQSSFEVANWLFVLRIATGSRAFPIPMPPASGKAVGIHTGTDVVPRCACRGFCGQTCCLPQSCAPP